MGRLGPRFRPGLFFFFSFFALSSFLFQSSLFFVFLWCVSSVRPQFVLLAFLWFFLFLFPSPSSVGSFLLLFFSVTSGIPLCVLCFFCLSPSRSLSLMRPPLFFCSSPLFVLFFLVFPSAFPPRDLSLSCVLLFLV